MKLLRKNKKELYNNLNVKYITENKLFRKTVKPSFTDKTLKDERITLVKNNKVISDDSKLAEIFGKYFGNIVQNLRIDGLNNISSDNDTVTIRRAIEKYQNHPSIKVIRENIDSTNNFCFDLIIPELISKTINNLDTSKATQQGGVPTKIMKDSKDQFSYFISASFNNAVNKGVFPDIPVANFAYENTPYCTGLKISNALTELEKAAETLLQWFKDNRMKANPDKYHLLINNTK